MKQLKHVNAALHWWLAGGVPQSFPSLYRLRSSQSQSRAHGWLGEWDTQEGMDPGLLPLYVHVTTSQAAELCVDFRCCRDIRAESELSSCDTSLFANSVSTCKYVKSVSWLVVGYVTSRQVFDF